MNSRYCYFMAVVLTLASAQAAAEVVLVGIFPGKAAILALDGAEPRAVRVGQKLGGILVVSAERDRAVIDVEGKRKTLLIGQYTASPSARESALLSSDSRGHFLANGSVNGGPIRFVVDTGATLVVLPAAEARRLAIDYRKGRSGVTQTANGPVNAWRVKLDTVKVGEIEINDIEAAVIESGLEIALLGMSFLNRVDMRQEGGRLTLTRRF